MLPPPPPPLASSLYPVGSDHNVYPSRADINILLKLHAKTCLFKEKIEIIWRTLFSCWNEMPRYILRRIIISHELNYIFLQLGFPGLNLQTDINKKGRLDNAKNS
jgi:hypothetical protein